MAKDESRGSPPISLESERRKAMMLVHAVEKDVAHFREKYLKRPRHPLTEDMPAFVRFVTSRAGARRAPKDCKEFAMLLDRVRTSANVSYRTEMFLAQQTLDRDYYFQELVASARARLLEAVEKHVGRYCLSFAPEAEDMDVTAVQEYENNINRWKLSIKESFALLDDILASLRDYGVTFENYVVNYSKILHYMGLCLQVFPRIYGPIKDWVTADEAYARKLQDEMNKLLRKKIDLTEETRREVFRADDMKHKARRKDFMSKKLNTKLHDALEDRRFYRKRELALGDALSKVESDLVRKRKDLDETFQKLYNRQSNSRTLYNKLVALTATLQDEIVKLERKQETMVQNLSKLKKERLGVQKEVHKLQVMYEKSVKTQDKAHVHTDAQVRDVRQLQEEGRETGEMIEVMSRIRSIKIHPATVKKLYSHGYTPGRRLELQDPLEEACKLVAVEIGRDWAYLYQKLPFVPPRSYEARARDIEVIDLSCQHLDVGVRGAALRSLQKWSKASQDASVASLNKTLRSIKKSDLARRVDRLVESIG